MTETAATAIIRERTDADLPGAAAALIEVHRTDGYPVEGVADPKAWLTGPALLRAWIGELNSKVVGHVSISQPQPDDAAASLWSGKPEGVGGDVAVLGRLFVLSAARGQSLGERLVKAASTYAQSQDLRLVLDVMLKDSAAIKLYEHLGWQRIGETEHSDGAGRHISAACYVGPIAGTK